MTKQMNGGSGATVWIIIGAVAGVFIIGGCAYYFMVHKKKGDAVEVTFNDDLYEAFVDTETA
jgi:flagellar basal body-associated protein FliL